MRDASRAILVAMALAFGLCGPAAADGPGVGTPAVVTLGDSAISGEAGRWAGNTNGDPARVDALGAAAYWDTPSGESIAGCHRSKAAQAFIGDGVLGYNLACSGARTATRGTAPGEDFKPGIDFYSDAQGRVGQARALQSLAATRNVRAVVVMIGANNYGFADIVTRCVANWVTSPSWLKNYCSDDSDMVSRFTAARVASETANVRDALLRVRDAMASAGYAASQYTILAQTYWSPVSRGAGFRYPESGWTRQAVGGCGVWNRDADWANDVVVNALNSTTRNAATASGMSERRGARPADHARRPAAVREHGRAARGAGARVVEEPRRRRQERVGRADPDDVDDLRALPAAGGQPRELLGPTRDAQLPAPGLQRRRRPRREVRACGQRVDRARRAPDGVAVGTGRVGGCSSGTAGVARRHTYRPSTTRVLQRDRGRGFEGTRTAERGW